MAEKSGFSRPSAVIPWVRWIVPRLSLTWLELRRGVHGRTQSSILTYDESAGFYDHVPAQKAVAPDNFLSPVDLNPGEVCTSTTGPTCDFTYTGYRIPLIVVSPYAKKHFVDHTVADYTAVLKLIETRFDLTPLTNRDAAQTDMTEFFNFNLPPWLTPPSPPLQKPEGALLFE